MRLYMTPVLAVLLVGSAVALQAQDKIIESEYFPLKVGAKWEYKSANAKFFTRVAKHEKIGDTMCALLETVKDSKVVASEHIAVKPDGVYRYSYQGQNAEPPLCIIKLPVKKGETWKFDFKLGGQSSKGSMVEDEEEITVAAGKYKTVKVQTKDAEGPATLKPQGTWWYAPGVGLVKQHAKVGDNEETFELEKFEAGK